MSQRLWCETHLLTMEGPSKSVRSKGRGQTNGGLLGWGFRPMANNSAHLQTKYPPPPLKRGGGGGAPCVLKTTTEKNLFVATLHTSRHNGQ